MIPRTIFLMLLMAVSLRAEVVRIEVKTRADITGMTYAAGRYEKLSGTIYFAVDPRNSANQIISDIDKAPKNAAGKVEFSSDFYMIKPKDATRGNGTVLFEVSNRGGKGMLGFFNRDARGSDPETTDDLGDGFLMQQGFTLALGRLAVRCAATSEPVARECTGRARADGRPIQGLVRSDFVGDGKLSVMPLADRSHIAYEVANVNDPANVLTVRDCVECARRTVPRDQWKFSDDNKVWSSRPCSRKTRSMKSCTNRRIRQSSASVRLRSAMRFRS